MKQTDVPIQTIKNLWLYRWITQFGMLGIIGQWAYYGIFRCPFVVPYVQCNNCPVITCHGRILSLFWGFWGAMLLSAVFFGRVFCGWACPGQMIHRIISKFAPLKLKTKKNFFNILGWGKYISLVLVLVLWLFIDNPRWAIPIRIGDFFTATMLTFEHANTYWLIRTFVVLDIIATGFIIANAWCRFACPAGGLLDLLKHFSIFRIYKTSDCNDCNKCQEVCSMSTRPDEANCINCCDCLLSCPKDAIKVGHKR